IRVIHLVLLPSRGLLRASASHQADMTRPCKSGMLWQGDMFSHFMGIPGQYFPLHGLLMESASPPPVEMALYRCAMRASQAASYRKASRLSIVGILVLSIPSHGPPTASISPPVAKMGPCKFGTPRQETAFSSIAVTALA